MFAFGTETHAGRGTEFKRGQGESPVGLPPAVAAGILARYNLIVFPVPLLLLVPRCGDRPALFFFFVSPSISAQGQDVSGRGRASCPASYTLGPSTTAAHTPPSPVSPRPASYTVVLGNRIYNKYGRSSRVMRARGRWGGFSPRKPRGVPRWDTKKCIGRVRAHVSPETPYWPLQTDAVPAELEARALWR